MPLLRLFYSFGFCFVIIILVQQVRQAMHALGHDIQFPLRVNPRSHPHIRVTQRLLRYKNIDVASHEQRAVRVTQSVNIDHPAHRIAFGNSGMF